MELLPKKFRPLSSLECPHCGSKSLYISLDFKKKWKGTSNWAVCIKKVEKNLIGLIKITGCGKTFKIEVMPRKGKLLVAL